MVNYPPNQADETPVGGNQDSGTGAGGERARNEPHDEEHLPRLPPPPVNVERV